MEVPTTVFEVMVLLNSVEDSDQKSAVNPGLTITQAKDIMIKGIQGKKEDFKNTSGDILALTNALSVIHNRKTRGIRPLVRKSLSS